MGHANHGWISTEWLHTKVSSSLYKLQCSNFIATRWHGNYNWRLKSINNRWLHVCLIRGLPNEQYSPFWKKKRITNNSAYPNHQLKMWRCSSRAHPSLPQPTNPAHERNTSQSHHHKGNARIWAAAHPPWRAHLVVGGVQTQRHLRVGYLRLLLLHSSPPPPLQRELLHSAETSTRAKQKGGQM